MMSNILNTENAERASLGCILRHGLTPEAQSFIETAESNWFSFAIHQDIFKTMYILQANNIPVDAINVDEHITQITGNSYGYHEIMAVAECALAIGNVEPCLFNFERIVRVNKAVALMDKAKELASQKLKASEAAEVIAEALQQVTFQRERKYVALVEAMSDYVTDVEERDTKVNRIIKTGVKDLDNQIGGFMAGDFNVIAGRPGAGKTEFAIMVAKHIGGTEPCLFISMEMDRMELAERVIAEDSRLSPLVLSRKSGSEFTDEEWGSMAEAIKRQHGNKMFLDDTASISPAQLRTKCINFKRDHPAAQVIMVDYIGLLDIPDKEIRSVAVGRVSRQMKVLAKELKVVMIGLCQLNRGSVSGVVKKPGLHDLRESGSIEQDANMVIFTHRESDLDPDSNMGDTAEIIVAKARKGGKGTVYMDFINGHFVQTDQESAHNKAAAQDKPQKVFSIKQ